MKFLFMNYKKTKNNLELIKNKDWFEPILPGKYFVHL